MGLTFAPKDIPPVSFVPKDNLHGLGYSGIDAQSALTGHVNLFEAPVVSSTGRKGIRGQVSGNNIIINNNTINNDSNNNIKICINYKHYNNNNYLCKIFLFSCLHNLFSDIVL